MEGLRVLMLHMMKHNSAGSYPYLQIGHWLSSYKYQATHQLYQLDQHHWHLPSATLQVLKVRCKLYRTINHSTWLTALKLEPDMDTSLTSYKNQIKVSYYITDLTHAWIQTSTRPYSYVVHKRCRFKNSRCVYQQWYPHILWAILTAQIENDL